MTLQRPWHRIHHVAARPLVLAGLVAAAVHLGAPDSGSQRQIPILVTGAVAPGSLQAGGRIPVTVTIQNDLPGDIEFLGFGTTETDWHAETASLTLVDIHRDGAPEGLFLKAPEVRPPATIAGQSRSVIKPGKSLAITTDARKWTIRGGWIPGRYRVTVRVNRLRADAWATVQVTSDAFEFAIAK